MTPPVAPYRGQPMTSSSPTPDSRSPRCGSRSAPATVAARALLLVALLSPCAVRAQASAPGRVVGSVVDSTTMRPLANAAVVLWDTRFRTVSDSLGRFTLDDVPPGRYSAAFFHTRLGQLGVSVGPTPVEVRPGRATGVDLAVPSNHTIEALQCLFEASEGSGPSAEERVVVGQVHDPGSETGLPSVRVLARWSDANGDRGQVETRSDGAGWYHFCSVPADRTLAITASFLDRATPRRELEEGSDPAFVDLPMTTLELSDVRGRLIDAETGQGVGGASVGLADTGFLVVSEPDGDFRFRDVLPGEYRLEATHLAYGTRGEPVNIASGVDVNLEMALAQRPIELPPIRVEVESENFVDMAMGGTVISSAELDKVRDRSRDVLDLLRNQGLPGLVVRRQSGEFCVGFTPGQSRMFRTGSCVPAVVFVDNVRAARPDRAVDLPADVVDRIVLFRPVEAGNLFGLGSGNGVLMIFTKR